MKSDGAHALAATDVFTAWSVTMSCAASVHTDVPLPSTNTSLQWSVQPSPEGEDGIDSVSPLRPSSGSISSYSGSDGDITPVRCPHVSVYLTGGPI